MTGLLRSRQDAIPKQIGLFPALTRVIRTARPTEKSPIGTERLTNMTGSRSSKGCRAGHRSTRKNQPTMVFNNPNLIFGAIGIFGYVGAEVGIGSFLVNYLGQPDIAGFTRSSCP